ncbi:MAG: tetraacyldisaccharide 4'-kinase [Bacteroidota bacterium]|nr:tetraacyldisaccharide 4'-kinase [Bacteroidota bacterium]
MKSLWQILRFLLLPFGLIYWTITLFRNFLYDNNILKSYKPNVPTFVVGNLSVGGTGKTPMTEYLIRLLSSDYKTATLSRGYKRQTKGFQLANKQSSYTDLGDEPFQFFTKFPQCYVAVDANRVRGIQKLGSLVNDIQLFLLDDAFQHRKIKGWYNILLTSYSQLYTDDFILPVGNLRENTSGANRANAIIITKCPQDITDRQMQVIRQKINPTAQQYVFFTTIKYDSYVYSKKQHLLLDSLSNTPKLLLAGIANPKPFFDYLWAEGDITLSYPDHHHFTDKDITNIKHQSEGRMIITTEKDYVRLCHIFDADNLFYLPIEISFVKDEDIFKSQILSQIEHAHTTR